MCTNIEECVILQCSVYTCSRVCCTHVVECEQMYLSCKDIIEVLQAGRRMCVFDHAFMEGTQLPMSSGCAIIILQSLISGIGMWTQFA